MLSVLEMTLTAMTLVALLSVRVKSATIARTVSTWQNPCGDGSTIGDTTSDVWASVTQVDGAHSTYYKEVSDSAVRAKRSIQELQDQLSSKARITTNRKEDLEDHKLSHMPTSEALSKAKETAHHVDSLRRARKELAEVSVYLKHMIEEEEDLYVKQTFASLRDEMIDFEDNDFYGGVLCTVHHTMIATKVSHNFDFNHEGEIRDSIMYRLSNEDKRNDVYYIILRDLGKLLDFMALEFLELARQSTS